MDIGGYSAQRASNQYAMMRNTVTTTRTCDEEAWKCCACDYVFVGPSSTFECERCGEDVHYAPQKIRDRLVRGRG